MTSIPTPKSKSRSSATNDDNDEKYNRMTPEKKSLRLNALKAEHDKIRNDRAHHTSPPSSTEKSKPQRQTNIDSPLSSGQSASCGQCSTPNTIFYCALCLSERIISHHTNVRRVDEMRQKGKTETSNLLGIELFDDHLEEVGRYKDRGTSARASIASTDPFEQTSEHLENSSWQDIDRKRMLRASRYHLERLMDEARARTGVIREDIRKRREKLATRKSELAKRRELLDKANRYKDDPSVADDQKGITIPGIELLRADVQSLIKENNRLGQRLAGTRSVLAQEAYTVFRVQPPAGTMASARATQGKSGPTSRSGRSKERYIPGAFVFDQQSTKRVEQIKAKAPAKDNNATPINPNDWTILGLVMPLSSDVKRFDRHKINGAITYTVQLLELVTFYLGISLPFLITHSAGTLFIKPNALWGSGTKQSLYLSSSSYTALSATESQTAHAGFGSMGASMISNLGASTMSTLESFVQLPSGKNLPWSKNAPTNDSADMPAGPRKEGIDEKTAAATKQFCTALTMLTYDVAYLAHQEGVQVDIVNAAGSVLRLLHRTVNSSEAGWKAHATLNKEYRLDDLTFTELDFPQLAQVIEAGGTHSRTKQGASKSTSTSTKGRDSQKTISSKNATSSNTKEIIDGSYIDARQAAQSILDVRKAEPNEKKKASEIVEKVPSTTKRSSLAAERRNLPSKLSTDRKVLQTNRAGTLDFLRSSALPTQTGQAPGAGREPKSSGSNTSRSDEKKTSSKDSPPSKIARNAESKVGTVGQKAGKVSASQGGEIKPTTPATSGGKVLFNGKEVKGKSTTESTKRGASRMPIDGRKQDEDEDGWAVL